MAWNLVKVLECFLYHLKKKSQISEMAKEFFARGLQGDTVRPLRQGH